MIKFIDRDAETREIVFSAQVENSIDYKPKEKKAGAFKVENRRLKHFLDKMEDWKTEMPNIKMNDLRKGVPKGLSGSSISSSSEPS